MTRQLKPASPLLRRTALPALLAAGGLLGSAFAGQAGAQAAALFQEPFRPQFHFTPERNWMNDPNGMVFYDGEFHLFYQYNPFGDKWGHMSWGHAVSKDLVHWQHLPLALAEENGVMIFSGSAVVDWNNSSGFGEGGNPPLVAIYTGHYTNKPLQNQQIAFSTDRGRTWTKYSGNPVLDIGERDFRDPKVFWHPSTKRWVMVVAWPVQRKVRFYASPDLKQWSHLSDFGPSGSVKGIWECPDLFPLPLEGTRSPSKWALIVNVGSGAPAGGSGCQYFIGEFDGTKFTLDETSHPKAGAAERLLPSGSAAEPALWADFGRDFYAAVSWSDVPKRDGRRLWIGWMSNWEYAQDVPTAPWRSAMSVPRELSLRPGPDGFRLVQRPVRELAKLRGRHHRLRNSTTDRAGAWLEGRKFGSQLLEIHLEVQATESRGAFHLDLQSGPSERTRLGYAFETAELELDRTQSGRTEFHPKFPGVHRAPVPTAGNRIRLRLLLDTSSIEVFANEGEAVITDLILPSSGDRQLRFTTPAASPALKVRGLDIWELRSAHR